MRDRGYEERVEVVRRRAHGRWSELLAAAGVQEQILKHRNGPCPLCGGTDRFQYTDKFGEGNYHCRHCGSGGGFKLLQAVKGIDFPTALRDIEQCLGCLPETPAPVLPESAPHADRMRRLVRRTTRIDPSATSTARNSPSPSGRSCPRVGARADH